MSRTLLLVCGLFGTLGRAEIQPFNILLQPDETTIHYYDGFIRAPGFIDMTDLTFVTSANNYVDHDPIWNDDNLNDDEYGDGGPPERRRLDGGIEIDGTAIDILVFMLPEKCSKSRKGCDYTEFGVGGKSSDGTLRWCCTNDAIDKGLCSRDEPGQYGRLIVDKTKFSGDSRYVNIPPAGDVTKRIKFGTMNQNKSGRYVVVMSNCNESGRPVAVKGKMVWKSEHGFLPGELYGIMRFYILLTLFYLAVFAWYGFSMLRNAESRIPIEKWILCTILLGLLEMFFQSVDFLAWNGAGYQRRLLAYFAIILGSLKQGISRCLAVMVGLGWGVVRDSLGTTMRTIVLLGTIYTAVSVLVDLLVVFAIEDIQTLSNNAEESIFDLAELLTFVLATLDVVFFMWMLDALNNTMEYLENMNQNRKLQRYLQLRSIFMFTILAAVIWAVFSVVNTYGATGILLEENEWVVEALKEIIYGAALLGVAILWRPNPHAREYAYVMELPASGPDGDNDLELTGSVPSAMDDDDEFEPSSGKSRNGFIDSKFDAHASELS